MRVLKVFIVDDEAPAREELRYLLEQFTEVSVIEEASSGEEALDSIVQVEPDAVFLDIHLQDRDGVDVGQELLESMVKPPVIIFASAYEIHAVRAFETEAVDYIVKPFSELRLEKTMNRVRRLLRSANAPQAIETRHLEQRLQFLLQSVQVDQQPRLSFAFLPLSVISLRAFATAALSWLAWAAADWIKEKWVMA